MAWCLHGVSMVFHEAVPKQARWAWQTWWEHCQTFGIQALTVNQSIWKWFTQKISTWNILEHIIVCQNTAWLNWLICLIRPWTHLGFKPLFPNALQPSSMFCDVLGVDVGCWMTWRWTLHSTNKNRAMWIWQLWTWPEQLDGLVLQAHGQLQEDDLTWLGNNVRGQTLWGQTDWPNKNTKEQYCQKMPEIGNLVLDLVWKWHTNTFEMLSVSIPHLISLCDTRDLRLSQYVKVLQQLKSHSRITTGRLLLHLWHARCLHSLHLGTFQGQHTKQCDQKCRLAMLPSTRGRQCPCLISVEIWQIWHLRFFTRPDPATDPTLRFCLHGPIA